MIRSSVRTGWLSMPDVRLIVAVLLTLLAATACGSSSQEATVTVGDATFVVDVLTTPQQKTRGLSGREEMEPGAGAIFVYGPGEVPTFWMKGMLFALDSIWIGEDCTVVDVTENAPRPEPGTPDARLPRFRSSVPATYNLEVNAGDVARLGVRVGDSVRFSGFDLESLGC